MTIADAASLLQSRKVSPVELTAQALEKIAELNPRLNAFITVTAEFAEQQARTAESEIMAGNYRGPLHGIPVAVKDLFYTRGIRTTAGSKILADFVPEFDATAVEKLRNAGAVLLGKTALHEFAYGMVNNNPHYGFTRNPWAPERTPGGSSGGSAVAVATGMAFSALGTDTGGSVRIPASFCGVAGLKPTFGRVSSYGVYPLGYTMDHVGPLARSVQDVAIVYRAIAGYDPQDDLSVDRPFDEVRLGGSIKGLRIGVLEDYFFERLQPEVERSVREAARVLRTLGASVTSVSLAGLADLTEAGRISLLAEAYHLHKQHLEERPGDIGDDVRLLIEQGTQVTATDYIRAQLVRQKIRRALEELLQRVDLILTPTTAITAFPFEMTTVTVGGQQEGARIAGTRLTRPFNASGHPALSVCCGFDSDALPIGLQIVGKLWDEATVLQAGYAYEQATEWNKRRPGDR
ncbi:MAG: Asp-tRNA(Asn)/Glu-tRNA(Gln) amidotransferase subunit GatA [Acidobacteria bacterium]|nr:Asp-tRNA(Asn)/Glu-tRNA(Gln) amidotransferase subunit GatA [Acidobacteriota bacterium]